MVYLYHYLLEKSINYMFARHVGLGVGSWASNLTNAVQFQVTSITLRDLTKKC